MLWQDFEFYYKCNGESLEGLFFCLKIILVVGWRMGCRYRKVQKSRLGWKLSRYLRDDGGLVQGGSNVNWGSWQIQNCVLELDLIELFNGLNIGDEGKRGNKDDFCKCLINLVNIIIYIFI